MKLCVIPDCGKKHYGRGYCKKHHWRLRKHGDPLHEMPGAKPGEIGRYITDEVLTHKGSACLIWRYYRMPNGYGMHYRQVASNIVCRAIHGPPPTPKHEAAHSCGNGKGGCVNPNHLSWKTHAENMADSVAHDTIAHGERQPGAKLTEADVLAIAASTERGADLARQYRVSRSRITEIRTGKGWAWLTGIGREVIALVLP